jgi:hypothetical protein
MSEVDSTSTLQGGRHRAENKKKPLRARASSSSKNPKQLSALVSFSAGFFGFT